MPRFAKSSLDTSLLYSKLKYRHFLSEKALNSKHEEAVRFLKTKGITPGKIREHATKLLTSGALVSSLIMSSPQISILAKDLPPPPPFSRPVETKESFIGKLFSILPNLPAGRQGKIEPLTPDAEIKISHLLYNSFGINAVPQLGSTRLNDVYGLIGAEQHLPRFPGDTVSQHDEYQNSGITPGLGGWGYFAQSKNSLTKDLYLKEKYYVAVQTLYLSDWSKRLNYLAKFYKFRKVVVVNPINGKTIICDVADAGPAKWTGKVFGGSPEVMAYLGLNVGMQKGPVILFFVDDPENLVPLGPLEYTRAELIAKK